MVLRDSSHSSSGVVVVSYHQTMPMLQERPWSLLKPVKTSGLHSILGKVLHLVLGSYCPSSFSLIPDNFTGALWFLCCEHRLVHIHCALVIPPRDSPTFLAAFVDEASAWVLLDSDKAVKGSACFPGDEDNRSRSFFPGPCPHCFLHKWGYNLWLSRPSN